MLKGSSFNNEVVDSNARATNAGGISEAQNKANALYSRLSGASFELVPSSYKEGVIYAGTGVNGDLTFTRAGDAWRTNEMGLIERTPYNLLSYSDDFSNTYYIKTLGTLTTNVTTAPNGTLTADLFTKTSTVNTVSQVVTNSLPYLTIGVHTLSVYVKQNVGNNVILRLDNGGNTCNADFTFSTKSFTNSGANIISSSYQEVGNGWFRLIVTGNVTSTSWAVSVALLFANPTSDSVYIWGAQLVEGTLPKTYFPTTDRLNVPRLDYTYGSSPALLLEPQRTNSAIYSEQLDLWSGGFNATATANTSISPDGTQNADNISITATNGYWRRLGLSAAASTSYTASVFVKKSSTTGTNNFRFYYNNNISAPSGGEFISVIDLTNLTITTTAVGTAGTGRPTIISSSLVPYGNGWYRIVVSFTTGTSAVTSNGEIGFLANGVIVNFDAWGAQFETGAYATSYIQTRAASVTRLSDTFTRNNVYTNGLISASGGTWFVECRGNTEKLLGSGGTEIVTAGLELGTGALNNSANAFKFRRGGGTQRTSIWKVVATTSSLLYYPTTNLSKFAIKWNGTTADVFENGVKVVTSSAFTTTALEFLVYTANQMPTYLQQMALWSVPLSDADCINLTADYTDGSSVIGSYEQYVTSLGGTVENLNGLTNLIQNFK